MLKIARLALLTALASPAALPAAAESAPGDLVRAELIGGYPTESGTRMAALHLVLSPGWKTYWRAPGDAGIPPSFDWRGSENIGKVAFHWPEPEVFDLGGMRTIGYLDDLVLPIEITPQVPGAPVRVAAQIELGVCRDICVPVTVDVGARLPDGQGSDPAIRAALAQRPANASEAGLRKAVCTAEPTADGLRLTATLDIPPTGSDEFAVIELADPTVWVSTAESRRSGARLVSVADLVPATAQPFALNRSDITITLFGGGRAVEIEGCSG